jgi:hypothetical protein
MRRLLDPLTSAAVLCIATGAVLLVALPPSPALATKEYARNEGKDCSHCHISDKGSGPRNATGKEYEANGYRFGVESWSSDENRAKYLRAKAALMSTWYGEADRLFDELAESETLPGGRALIDGTRRKFRMFPRTWLRSAKKLLDKGTRGLPNALGFLVKLESQFPESDEGKEAVTLLDGLAAKDASKDAVAAARATERARIRFLSARTELELAEFAKARDLFAEVLADTAAEPFHADVQQLLAEMPEGT